MIKYLKVNVHTHSDLFKLTLISFRLALHFYKDSPASFQRYNCIIRWPVVSVSLFSSPPGQGQGLAALQWSSVFLGLSVGLTVRAGASILTCLAELPHVLPVLPILLPTHLPAWWKPAGSRADTSHLAAGHREGGPCEGALGTGIAGEGRSGGKRHQGLSVWSPC